MLTAESLSEALTYFREHHMPEEELKPRYILVWPSHWHYVERIRADIKRRETYAAGRRLARHIHSLRGK